MPGIGAGRAALELGGDDIAFRHTEPDEPGTQVPIVNTSALQAHTTESRRAPGIRSCPSAGVGADTAYQHVASGISIDQVEKTF